MRQKLSCEIVICDGCGVTLGDGADFIPHFQNEGEGSDYKADWEWWTTPGGAELCPKCLPAAVDSCEKCGHLMEDHELLDEPCMEDGCKCDRFYWEPKK